MESSGNDEKPCIQFFDRLAAGYPACLFRASNDLRGYLQHFVELPRSSQQFELGLLPLEVGVQIAHPFFAFIQPRLLDIAQDSFSLRRIGTADTATFCCASCSSSRATSFAASVSCTFRDLWRTSALTCCVCRQIDFRSIQICLRQSDVGACFRAEDRTLTFIPAFKLL